MTRSFRSRLTRVLLLAVCATGLNTGRAQETASEKGEAASPQLEVDVALISPLALPDTSSPRATLKSFVDNFEATFRPYHENRTTKIPRRETPTAIRMLRTLDTSELPPAQKLHRAAEAALLLNEVMSRVDLPPYEEIPDAEAMQALPPGESRIWRVPRTDIQIVKVEEGARTGEYLFSADTVERSHEFYDRIKDFAVRPGAMEGLWKRIASEPGPFFPVSGLGDVPDWLRTFVLGQSVWKWIATIITIAFWIFLFVLVFRLTRPREGQPRYWLRFAVALAMLPITYAIRLFLERGVVTLGVVYDLLNPFFVGAFYFFGALVLLNLGSGIAQLIISSPRIDSKSVDAHLIAVTGRTVAWVGVILLILKGADDIGIPLPAVIAGLGVGGLALGIAARPTLENLIAGVTLYLDKPIRVGEFCQFGDVMGTVEQIGLRSTSIRRWGGNRITVPNALFAEFQLDNLDDIRNIWIRTRLSLRYETTPEQLRYVLAKLREMLFAHPRILSPRVRFVEFGESSLEVEILCYTDTGVWAEWHAIREDVYLRTMEIVKESGTSFAFPSQTTYFARDEGLDDERQQAAEQQVAAWRAAGELPFPDMASDDQEALTGTLDFPPKGSAVQESEQETTPEPRKD
jgi:MscS family membrane protein